MMKMCLNLKHNYQIYENIHAFITKSKLYSEYLIKLELNPHLWIFLLNDTAVPWALPWPNNSFCSITSHTYK